MGYLYSQLVGWQVQQLLRGADGSSGGAGWPTRLVRGLYNASARGGGVAGRGLASGAWLDAEGL